MIFVECSKPLPKHKIPPDLPQIQIKGERTFVCPVDKTTILVKSVSVRVPAVIPLPSPEYIILCCPVDGTPMAYRSTYQSIEEAVLVKKGKIPKPLKPKVGPVKRLEGLYTWKSLTIIAIILGLSMLADILKKNPRI
jgi:uncharacterized protein YbaR (Trm112 family)